MLPRADEVLRRPHRAGALVVPRLEVPAVRCTDPDIGLERDGATVFPAELMQGEMLTRTRRVAAGRNTSVHETIRLGREVILGAGDQANLLSEGQALRVVSVQGEGLLSKRLAPVRDDPATSAVLRPDPGAEPRLQPDPRPAAERSATFRKPATAGE